VAAAGQDPDEFIAQALAEEPAAKARAAVLVDTAMRIAQRGYSSIAPPTVRR
jgi:hypothetical protein